MAGLKEPVDCKCWCMDYMDTGYKDKDKEDLDETDRWKIGYANKDKIKPEDQHL